VLGVIVARPQNRAGLNIGRGDHHGNTNPVTIKGETIGIVAHNRTWRNRLGWRRMIVTAAMLVEKDDEHRLLPRVQIAAQRIVQGAEELLAKANDMAWMHIIGQIDLWRRQAYVRIITWLDEGIIRQNAFTRMSQEGIEQVEILRFSNKLRQCQRLR